jgi:hypothetical protein
MKNHGTSHIANCLNGPFGDAILMMSVGAAEPQFLVRFIDVCHEPVGLKGSAVSQVVLNYNTIVHAHSLEPLFGSYRLAGREPDLMLHVHVRIGMVNEDAPALEGG